MGDASLLPNAKQQFFDSNGDPLTSGTVDFYLPSTSTRKTTWQNSGQTSNNTNPVNLDAGGRAVIYGSGSYRQVVKAHDGTTIWDAVTTATPSSTVFLTDNMPIGSLVPFAGIAAPTNWLFVYGQAISRTTYANLMAAITVTDASVTCVATSATVGGWADVTNIKIGAVVEASCLAPGTVVATIASPTSITVSPVATGSGTVSATVFPYGNGNGSTTFTLPDLRSRSPIGADNIGGTAAARITAGAGLGATLGLTSPLAYVNTVPTRQTLTSGASATYTRPAGVTRIVVTMIGGGGGGSGDDTGAGVGGVGGTTSFNSITAIGGEGGRLGATTGGAGGNGGTGGAGSATTRSIGSAGNTGGDETGGNGGTGLYGAGAGRGAGQNGTGNINGAANTGGGGGGGANSADGGGGGGAGEIVTLVVSAPAGTYVYTVGAGGTAGAGNAPGGVGGSGVIVVDEYYSTTFDFTPTAAGTGQPSDITFNYIIKYATETPSGGAGVISIGGMTGDITCGTNVTCAGNDISVLVGTGSVTSVGLSVPGSIFGVTGTPVTTSGTLGLTVTGTSGGVPYFSSSSALGSSAELTASRIMLGGGAGSAPSVLGSLGTTTTVLHGNAAGAPTFGAVSLTADVSGTLPVGSGGTGATTFTANGPLIGNGTGAVAQGTRSGNTTVFGTTSGSLTSGHCVSIDASGNLVDAGAACVSGNQSANTVYAGPTSGGATTPAFRSLVVADLPTVTVAKGGTGVTSMTANAPLFAGATSTSNIQFGSVTGTSKILVSNDGGSIVSGNCAKWDANSDLVDSGSACGGGTGPSGPSFSVQINDGAGGFTGSADVTLSGSFGYAGVSLGSSGGSNGVLLFTGSTTGNIVSIVVDTSTGNYTMALPIAAGTAGQPLLSAGGGTTPMTFGTLGVAAGGTGATSAGAARTSLGLGSGLSTTKTVRAAGGATDCTLIFTNGILTGGSC